MKHFAGRLAQRSLIIWPWPMGEAAARGAKMTVLRSNVAVKSDEEFEAQKIEKARSCTRPEAKDEKDQQVTDFAMAAYRRQRDKIIMWDEV